MNKIFNYNYDNKLIIFFIDEYLNIFSSLDDIINILNYKYPKKYINNINKLFLKNIDDKLYISEYGLYYLLSNNNNNKDFKQWLLFDIIPEIKSIIQHNFKISIKKKNNFIKKLISKLNKNIYDDNDMIYIKINKNYDIDLYKIGYTRNMNKRINVYKTGHKDDDIVFNIKCNNSKLVEDIIKYKLEGYQYEKRRELYNCDINIIINTIKITINELKNGKINTPYIKIVNRANNLLDCDN